MTILAIDPATHCGFALSTGGAGTWDLSVRRDESGGMRLVRLRGKLREIHTAAPLDVVFYEAARHAASNGALIVQAELQGVIKLFCEENKIDYRGVSPSEIKKFATGKGNANKQAMIDAAKAQGWDVQDDNEADARWLLKYAEERLC